MSNISIANDVTVTGETPQRRIDAALKCFAFYLTGTGSISATVQIQAKVVIGWVDVDHPIEISGSGSAMAVTDPFLNPYKLWRVNVTAISGTDATLNVLVEA